MIVVSRAPAYLTIQDMGRHGYLSVGVPAGGAMDRWSLATLNHMLGNDRSAAGLEWALNGGALEFSGNATFAFGGADAVCSINGVAIESFRAATAKAGDTLIVDRIASGRFLYIAVAGGIACDSVLGSQSTFVAGGFGGFAGRRIRSGDSLETGMVRRRARRHHVVDPLPRHLRPRLGAGVTRIVARSFDSIDLPDRGAAQFTVSAASDRTGYRLEGPELAGGASVTSEPVCHGTIQLPPNGAPIVLMADAPTIGGYRLLGSVITADLGSFAQKLPGESIIFQPVSVREAQAELRQCEATLVAVSEWAL